MDYHALERTLRDLRSAWENLGEAAKRARARVHVEIAEQAVVVEIWATMGENLTLTYRQRLPKPTP
jgi:hypothetical protein